jgi:RNA polymerase subunit RPABC4/transcription elongation factor Spt4
MSSFKTSKLGMAESALEAAGSLFGGVFGRAASGAYDIQRAVGGAAHDSALKEAVGEIKPLFKQCKRCGNWICEPVCFNKKAQLCDACAPDLEKEMAAAQAEAAKEQVYEKAKQVDWLKDRDVATVSGAACPQCGAATQGGKFCPDCGAALQAKKKCKKCGAVAEGSPKFCPECGDKLTA